MTDYRGGTLTQVPGIPAAYVVTDHVLEAYFTHFVSLLKASTKSLILTCCSKALTNSCSHDFSPTELHHMPNLCPNCKPCLLWSRHFASFSPTLNFNVTFWILYHHLCRLEFLLLILQGTDQLQHLPGKPSFSLLSLASSNGHNITWMNTTELFL